MALPGALVLAVTTAALWAAAGPVSIVLLYPTLVALLVDRTPEAERGLALGTLSASWDVGVAVGALLIGFTVERTSYGGGFLLGAVTTALGLLAFGALERRRAARRDLPRRAAGVSF